MNLYRRNNFSQVCTSIDLKNPDILNYSNSALPRSRMPGTGRLLSEGNQTASAATLEKSVLHGGLSLVLSSYSEFIKNIRYNLVQIEAIFL
jgi:hypothetical protein